MRLKQFDFDPANANLIGFASNVTGATFTLTANDSGDSLAHQVSIRNDTANDHSGKTVTLVGTDADGRAQTEVVTGPGISATVESAKYFLTLTSATPSATIGADTFDIGWVDEFASKTYGLDVYQDTPSVVQVTVTGTINFDVETTLSDIQNTDGAAPFSYSDQSDFLWLNDANFTGKTATLVDTLAKAGNRAMRVVANSYTDGAELQVIVTHPRSV